MGVTSDIGEVEDEEVALLDFFVCFGCQNCMVIAYILAIREKEVQHEGSWKYFW